jgi:NAD(P)-dependent dehydrogenase (short-subunit alcohol dehydrogenase family)
MLLNGDTALITGAATGIGRAIAKAAVADGAKVFLTDVAEGPLAEVANELDAGYVVSDLSQEGAAKALFQQAVESLGQVSIFVHSASPRRQEDRTTLVVSEAEWDLMINVGLRSGFLLGQAAGNHMKERGIKGRMLYLTSLHAEHTRNLPHYSATKAGMTMVMQELARALGPDGIRVNAIAPGAVPFGGFVANIKAWEPRIPMGRMGKPEDIANMAIAVLSERFGSYVTGTTIVVDGGLHLYNWQPFGKPVE